MFLGHWWTLLHKVESVHGTRAASTRSGAGDVEVWQDPSANPSSYSNAQCCYYVWPPGDDNAGNTFVETNASVYVCELYYGDSQGLLYGNSVFGNYDPTINFPGSSMWDGEYLTFTDQEYEGGNTTAIYETLEDVSDGLTVVGDATLKDTCDNTKVDVVQPFIVGKSNTPVSSQQGTVVVGGNLYCKGRFDYWTYPSGGNPTKTLKSAPKSPTAPL